MRLKTEKTQNMLNKNMKIYYAKQNSMIDYKHHKTYFYIRMEPNGQPKKKKCAKSLTT